MKIRIKFTGRKISGIAIVNTIREALRFIVTWKNTDRKNNNAKIEL